MMKKLLLADDSITIQKVVGIIFATEDFELTMTDDGKSALEKAQELLPDLVIADISMPGMDGFELCRAIKTDPTLSHTSVLLLPGAFDHFDETKAQDVCADGWLTKPFESQALLDKVSQLVEAEPVRMVDNAAPAAEEDAPESEEETAAHAEEAVDETVLGLKDVDAVKVDEGDVEESPDDIWDAVSFEEDDLQSEEGEEESDSPLEEVFAVAGDASDAGEQATEYPVSEDEETPVEESQESVSTDLSEAVEDAEIDFQAETDVDQKPQEESGNVDFSTFSDDEPEVLQGEKLESEEQIYDLQDEEPLELSEESAVDDFAETDDEPVVSSLHEGAAADEETESEDVPVETGISIDDQPPFTGSDTDFDAPIADDVETPTEPYSFNADDVAEADLDAQVSDKVEDDDVLDLDEGEIIEDNIDAETVAVAEENVNFNPEQTMEVEEAESVELVDGAEDSGEADADFEFSDAEPVDVESDATDGFAVESEQVDVRPDEADDDGFYFDEAEEDGASTVDVANAAATAAAVGFTSTEALDKEESAVTAVAQVESQLSHLSEDELKAVVSKVAGPMIEKLAGEMLEQIAWEVVPDLAEALIKEEIRKIKEAVSN